MIKVKSNEFIEINFPHHFAIMRFSLMQETKVDQQDSVMFSVSVLNERLSGA